jgi:uncharacterized protein YecE (DUF72 family)
VHRVTGTLRIGCPMWANRDWVGPYYPAGTRPGDELGQYVQWCTAVEGNTTFYALPPPATISRWAEVTPDLFRFVFKLPKVITHDRRLRGVDAELTGFLTLLEPLGARCGPFSIQLPPSFGPNDVSALVAFLRHAPREVRWAVEVRHPQFFDGGPAHVFLDRVLTDLGVERITLDVSTLFSKPPTDGAEREGWSRKPRLPVVPHALTAAPIVRFIGRTAREETIAGWHGWLSVVAGWLQAERSPIVFVHTPDNVEALGLARLFHEQVRALVPELDPLPIPAVRLDPVSDDEIVQPTLFD